MTQLNDGEPTGPREVMNESYDKSVPVHDPTPRPDGPREVFPVRFAGGEKDFRPINTIEYPDVQPEPVDEEDEVEEVLSAPKDSSAPESVPSSTSETPTTSDSSEVPTSPASAEKDSGQPKEPELGSQTSSLPPMIGDVTLPASTPPPIEENQTPGSPAKQN